MTVVTYILYTYAPIILYRIYVVDELVRQRIHIDADRRAIAASKTDFQQAHEGENDRFEHFVSLVL